MSGAAPAAGGPLTEGFTVPAIEIGSIIAWGIIAVIVFFVLKKAWPTLRALVHGIELLANLGPRLQTLDDRMKTQGDVLERVRAQVENSHTTNLREELDDRHKETRDLITGIQKDVGRLDTRDILRIQAQAETNKKLDEHLSWAGRQEDRIDKLERKEQPDG